jgi:hypothetical protein
MRRPPFDPLALDDDSVERLLTGDLPPAQVPPAYAMVAELLAARHRDLPAGPRAAAAAPDRAGGRRGGGRAGDRWRGRRSHRACPGTGARGGPDHPGRRRRRGTGDPGPAGPVAVAGAGHGQGGAMQATAFQALVQAAGGEDRVPAYCQDLLPGDQKLKESKNPGEPEPPGGGNPSPGVPPPGTGGGNQDRPGSRGG